MTRLLLYNYIRKEVEQPRKRFLCDIHLTIHGSLLQSKKSNILLYKQKVAAIPVVRTQHV